MALLPLVLIKALYNWVACRWVVSKKILSNSHTECRAHRSVMQGVEARHL